MIDFIDVEKTYKSGVEALKGVSFTIEDGEFVFVIGKSGSGKSTLLKCITCEETPTSGKVTIDNFDISHMSRALVPVLRRRIGMIYQDFRLIETKTVAENVAFAGEIIGVPKQNLMNTVLICLSVVGLKDKADCYPQELSGGEQQRVAIARAMLNNPKIVVADEPTGNLDPETSESIMALLLSINKSGATVVVCTHDSNLVDKMKQRVIEIEQGYIVRDVRDGAYSGESNIANPLPEFGGYELDDESDTYVDYMDETEELTEEYAEEEPLPLDPEADFSFGDDQDAPKKEELLLPSKEADKAEEKEEDTLDIPTSSNTSNEVKKDEKSEDEGTDWVEEISFDDIDLLDDPEED